MTRNTKQRPRRRGFTLLEVLLVLAILVILTSTVGYYIIGAQKKANRRAAEVQINLIATVLQDYHIDIGSFPTTEQGLGALTAAPAGLPNNKWAGPYAAKAIPLDPWGNPYQYELTGSDSFRIWSFGPDASDGSGDEITSG
jgi:general secretion pathway protein G